MKKFLLSLFLLSFLSTLIAQELIPELFGEWHGKGKIIVTWCNQKTLDFDIKISEDGTVTGKIGDAEIYDAKAEHRSAIMEALGNHEFIINGKLKGKIVEKENIERDGFKFMFDYKDEQLKGGFHSSGSKFGGKEKMVLTVVDIVLRKK